MSKKVKLNETDTFAVLDLSSISISHKNAGAEDTKSKRDQTRANLESGSRMASTGLIGGDFAVTPNPPYRESRNAVFESLYSMQEARIAEIRSQPITVTLPSGDQKQGEAFKTTAYDIAKGISQGLADSVVIARVEYTSRLEGEDVIVACDEDEEAEQSDATLQAPGELWDLNRPLVGDCKLTLLKFDDPEAKTVFWHSSAHLLGAAIEEVYGAHLTIGPPLLSGFYYDSYMGSNSLTDDNLKVIESKANELGKKKYPFQRLVLTKDEALRMFAANPFKVNLIRNKIPDGGKTTVYKCGPLIDLCMGPHLPHTGRIKAFATVKASSTNWLGQVTNDSLQRVYGIAFPDKDQLKQWKQFQEQAKQRDHRLLGTKQELFFFHQLSPGSSFWLPHGARVYNRLIDFIKKIYWDRGYVEVITPNVFNIKLWEQSGHAEHYKSNMFVFDVEGQEFGMKPMNCPGHCLMFAHRVRSYRELPLRVADFGVLHRNELSGALTGLTRVRRFQQDDAHIFCTQDQIKQEVLNTLEFMKIVYTAFGMTYRLALSTRPAKALGDPALWDIAEAQLAQALDDFAGSGNWRMNPGDGAFYGPKIDIHVFDALDRMHQCATVQLDFQLPIRFGLQYNGPSSDPAEAVQRPVMVHRAILGSVERMSAVLIEHFGGKWPFWLSPRQICIVPIDLKFLDYADEVQAMLHSAGFYVDVDDSSKTLNKKVREAQIAQYNFILVVGAKEAEKKTVNIRTRDNEVQGEVPLCDLIARFNQLCTEHK